MMMVMIQKQELFVLPTFSKTQLIVPLLCSCLLHWAGTFGLQRFCQMHCSPHEMPLSPRKCTIQIGAPREPHSVCRMSSPGKSYLQHNKVSQGHVNLSLYWKKTNSEQHLYQDTLKTAFLAFHPTFQTYLTVKNRALSKTLCCLVSQYYIFRQQTPQGLLVFCIFNRL